jgi:prepilin peptidase CpaA
LLGVLGWAAWVDFTRHRIPNAASLGGAALALAAHAVLSGLEGMSLGLLGWLVAAMFMFPGYAAGMTGAGDVKLLGAVGAIVGPELALSAGVFTLLAGGLMGLSAVFVRRDLVAPWSRYGGMLVALLATGRPSYVPPQPGEAMARRMPFAGAIAAGTAIALAWPDALAPLVRAVGLQ